MMEGDLFEGNLLEKGLDILNLPGYAMAGIVDSVLSGEDPLEGMFEGLQGRKSFVDTFKNHDVPLATPLGIAADVLTPTLPFAHFVKMARAKNLLRLKEAVDTAHRPGMTILENVDEAAKLHADGVVNNGFGSRSASIIDDANDVQRQTLDAVNDAGTPSITNPAGVDAARDATQVFKGFDSGRPLDISMNPNAQARALEMNEVQSALRPGLGSKFMEPIVKVTENGPVITGYKFNWSNASEAVFGKAFTQLKNNVRSVNSTLRESPLFKGVGETFAEALGIQNSITTLMRLAYQKRIDEIAEILGKNADDQYYWTRLVQNKGWGDVTEDEVIRRFGVSQTRKKLIGHVIETPQQYLDDPERLARLKKAVEMTKKLMQEDFEAKTKYGVRQVENQLTQAVRRLTLEEHNALKGFLSDTDSRNAILHRAQIGELNPAHPIVNVARIAKGITDEGGELDDLHQLVTMPLREVSAYLPARHTEAARFLKAKELEEQHLNTILNLRNLTREQFDALVRNANETPLPWWTPRQQGQVNQAAAAARNQARELVVTIRQEVDRLVKADIDEPSEIIAGFQYSRHGDIGKAVLRRGDYITDPRELLYKWGSDSALSIGSAKAFGGKNELYYALRKRYLQNVGYHDMRDVTAMDPLARHGLEFIDRAFRVSTGTAQTQWDKFVSGAGSLADMMFLGPRTVLVQTLNLANSASHAGVGNAMLGMAEALTNKEMRDVATRLGAVLPNMSTPSSNASTFQKIMDGVMYMYKGIRKSDSLMRMQSSIAGGLDAISREGRILELVKAGHIDKAKKLVENTKLDYMTDLSYLLTGQARMTNADLMRISQIASTKANFAQDVLNSSMIFNTPAGRFFGKFKQFAFHQWNFIWDNVDRIRKNPRDAHAWGRITRYAATFPWVYQHVNKALSIFKSPEANKREKENAAASLRAMLMTGALGFMGDAALALGTESEALGLGVVTGPIPNAGLRLKKLLWNMTPTPISWNPEKAWSAAPNFIRQPVNAWQNLTQ
jgi:hypothetical protein